MSGLTMDQVPRLRGLRGFGAMDPVSAVAEAVGVSAQAGASIYGDWVDSKQSRKELQARQQEFADLLPVMKRQQEAQSAQAKLDTIAAVRQTQIAGAYQALYSPYLLGAVAIGGLALLAVAVSKKGGPK